MNLYSIRDRLVNYYMVPFPAPSHHQVKAAIAQQINNGDTNAISQAPHQFEIWQLATLDEETGRITECREYICDVSSLIRGGVRDQPAAGTGIPENARPEAPGSLRHAVGGPYAREMPVPGIPQAKALAEAQEGAKAQ